MATIRCPRWSCRSTDCVPVTQGKKYKTGRGLAGAAVGHALFGPVGALVGAGTGFNGRRKIKFVCRQCGKVFEAKL